MEMHSELVNLNEVFVEVYNELIKLQSERNVVFNVDKLPIIEADPIMIRILIENILSNALKYTLHKESAIINVTFTENENEYIISLKDNGAGFNMKYSSKLFGVFQRLHSQNEFEGSGVGLAIAQKILNKHKGKAWITGKENKGATFSFCLPKTLNYI